MIIIILTSARVLSVTIYINIINNMNCSINIDGLQQHLLCSKMTRKCPQQLCFLPRGWILLHQFDVTPFWQHISGSFSTTVSIGTRGDFSLTGSQVWGTVSISHGQFVPWPISCGSDYLRPWIQTISPWYLMSNICCSKLILSSSSVDFPT